MIKNMLVFATLCAGLFACSDNSSEPSHSEAKNNKSARNLSITRANAYNDLFLDSNQVEKFITQQKVNDTIASSMRFFYNERNFEYAWFNTDGLTEQALAFRNLYEYDDTANSRKSLDRRLDGFMLNDSVVVSGSNATIIKNELLLTWRFINYVWNKYDSEKAREAAFVQLIPAKKQEVFAMADQELDNDAKAKIIKNDWYGSLRKQLRVYTDLAKKGGWPTLSAPKKKLKVGSKDSLLLQVKNRLQLTGEYQKGDTSIVFTPELKEAIKKYQIRHGLADDGVVSASLIKVMNVSATERVKQLLVNLNRICWMPAAENGRMILVNIPEYRLHVVEGKDSVLNMAVVVGKQGHNTMMFSGNLNQVVFSPYWNVPPAIVENEIMPDMEKNKDYLAENNMEITGEEEGLPVVRQLPGDKNELGKVKFLFPNSFNIYFHDTPHKDLFKQTKRAFSHGCIRLSEPVALAKYLLKDQQDWTDERIDSAMNSGKEKFVRVKDPIPVLIYYYTTWVDGDGDIQWREDTYGRDKKMMNRLFGGAGVSGQEVASK